MTRKNIVSYYSAINYCILISWTASKFYTIIRVLLLLVSIVCPYINLILTQRFMNLLAYNDSDIKVGGIYLGIITFLTIFGKMLNEFNQFIQQTHNEIINQKITEKILKKICNINIKFFDSPEHLDIIQAASMDAYSVSDIVWCIFNGIASFGALLISTGMVILYNNMYAIIIIVTSIPSAFYNRKFAKLIYQWHLETLSKEREADYIYYLAREKKYAQDIRLYNLNSFLLDRYRQLKCYCIKGKKSLRKKKLFYTIPMLILPDFFILLFMFYIMKNILIGTGEVGDFTLYTGLFTSIIQHMNLTISNFVAVYEEKLKVETLKKFDNIVEQNNDGKFKLVKIYEIEFLNVSFKYPYTYKYILKNISFKVSVPQKMCIVGTNGSGKSTLIKLLLRFYDPTEGKIFINGKNIKDYSIESVREKFSVLFQNYVNYGFTIKENISLSDTNQKYDSDKKILNALNIAQATGILDKLTYGLDTNLYRIFDNMGFEPSGGESQKIALARAIYGNGDVLILDEPTSALDPKSERDLYNKLEVLTINRIIIYTTHRLITANVADKILLLDNGEIIETGTHNELMALDGEYAALYRMQVDL